jgi:hypothetical protein
MYSLSHNQKEGRHGSERCVITIFVAFNFDYYLLMVGCIITEDLDKKIFAINALMVIV